MSLALTPRQHMVASAKVPTMEMQGAIPLHTRLHASTQEILSETERHHVLITNIENAVFQKMGAHYPHFESDRDHNASPEGAAAQGLLFGPSVASFETIEAAWEQMKSHAAVYFISEPFARYTTIATGALDNVIAFPVVSRIEQRDSVRLLNIIRSFYSLEENWDLDGGAKPASKTIDNADYFLQNLEVDSLVPPTISLDGSGEISFAWQTKYLLLDVGMDGDDTYYYYGERLNGTETFREESRDVRLPLPKAIWSLLKK